MRLAGGADMSPPSLLLRLLIAAAEEGHGFTICLMSYWYERYAIREGSCHIHLKGETKASEALL